MLYALVQEGELVRQYVQAPDEPTALEQAQGGEVAVPVSGALQMGARCVDGALAWPEPSLADLKTARKVEASAYRNARQEGGCNTALGRVDTDFQRSMTIINSIGAAGSAAIAAKIAFGSKKLTLTSGSQVALGATQAAQLGITVNAFLDQCQEACLAVKAKIDAAPTADAIAAVDITAGYPA